MAAGEYGTTRQVVDILKLADDDKERYIWKYLLETNYKEIDNYLKIKDVSISKDQYGDVYFASYPSSADHDGKLSIVRSLTKASSTLHALQLNSRPLNLPERGCKVYQIQNAFWIVGEKNAVDSVAKSLHNHDSLTGSDQSNADKYQSWVNLELIDIYLTEEEQAFIILHDLRQLPSLKKELVKIEKDVARFTVRVRIPKVPDSPELENDIRTELKSKKGQLGFKQVSFNPREIKFLCTDPVYEYVDKNLNYSRPSISCVWYIKSEDNMVNIYTRITNTSYQTDMLKKSIITGSMPVPQKYFSTEEIQIRILDLKKKYENKVEVYLSSSYSTLHYMSVSDQEYKLQKDLKSLTVTKTLQTNKEQGILLKTKVKELENTYSVNILEEEKANKFGWKIQGGSSSVTAAYDELKASGNALQTKAKDYQIDEDIKTVQSSIEEIIQTGLVSIAEVSSYKAPNPTDLRNSFSSYRWILPNGNDLKIVNADYRWLLKDAILLKTNVVSDRRGETSVCFNSKYSEVTLYLPPWKESVAKEKEILRSALDDLFKRKELDQKSICLFLVLNLREPEKIGWSWKKFLPEVLVALSRHNVSLPLVILEPSKNEFEKGSDAIQSYADMVCRPRRIETKIEIGQLARMKCDAIINSTHEDLLLNYGAVSGTILKLAGDKIQDECNDIMNRRFQSKITSEEVAVTNGYNLNCRFVFHGALASWPSQTLDKFVYKCLKEAELRQLSRIAFPSLGTGKLGYPADQVAKIMIQTVRKYADDNNIGSLKEVIFVIYEKDNAGYQAFQTEEKRQKQGNKKFVTTEKCPKPNLVRITVTGKNEKDVDHTFHRIEKKITETETEEQMNIEEPESQEMERKDVPDPIDDENEYKEENTKSNSTSKAELASRSSTFDLPPQDTDDTCYVNVGILTDEGGSPPHSALRQILKQHGIKSDQIICCPDYPMKARLRFKNRTDANDLIENMKNCSEYELRPGIPDAVVNIRAKLNRAIAKYLENGDNCQHLQQWSGVKIVKEDDEIVLTGDLTEISEARNILIRWKAQQGTGFTCTTKADSKGTKNQNRYDKEFDDEKMQKKLSKTSSTDESYSEHPVDCTSNTNHIELDNQRNIEQHGSSSFGKGNNINTSKASVTKNEPYIQSQDKELSHNLYPDLLTMQNQHSTKPSTADAGAIPKQSKSNQQTDRAINNFGSSTQIEKTTRTSQKPDALPKTKLYPNLQKQNPENVSKPNEKSNISAKKNSNKPILIAPMEDSVMMITKEGVKVYVYQGSICFLKVDCIVNSSNLNMKHQHGLSNAILIEAGQTMEDQCMKYIEKHGILSQNEVCITDSGFLSHYRKILHINAPIWDSSQKDEHFFDSLSNAVEISLHKANQEQMTSIGIPAISSGFGSVPAVIRNKAYPHGVIKFSEHNAKKLAVKEIHFVDIDPSVVDYIKAAFLYAVPEPTVNFVEKLKKIPQMIKEKFTSDVRSYEGAGKNVQLELTGLGVVIIVCDSALSSSLQHVHIRKFMTSSGCREIKCNETAVVITEDKKFSGTSKSSKTCRTKGGQSFLKIYAGKGKPNKRRKAGDIEDMFGGDELGFYHVYCAIMPKFAEKARIKDSPEQTAFFKKVNECNMNLLKLADEYGVKHLCMPVLCRDFYDNTSQWFLECSVVNQIAIIKEFARNRNRKNHLMIVHVVTNADDRLFKILDTEMSKELLVETQL